MCQICPRLNVSILKIHFLNNLPPSLSRAAYFRQTGGSKEKHYLMIHASKTFLRVLEREINKELFADHIILTKLLSITSE